ncbi:site-specific integrase [Carnobacterium pleistocenium]|uniref:site-specific integrase n=1 Tax=Carnobacterium pleistocenium TaxID=181073 RepID=UPI00068C98E4|nr:site-specific integrase [Carnobacterium pleistocenium]
MLAAFKEYTIAVKGLSEKTIERHIENLDYYLNIYLIEYEQATPINSTESAGNFLSNFFVEKNLASSSASLKQCGSSLKKLYQFLYEAGEISKTDLAEVNEFIKLDVQEGVEYLD